MRTSVKKLAAIEKCEAAPPSILSILPKGVSTASNATEPTTRRDMFLDCRLPIWIFDWSFLFRTLYFELCTWSFELGRLLPAYCSLFYGFAPSGFIGPPSAC